MAKTNKKEVKERATALLMEIAKTQPRMEPPTALPIVRFWYPLHGKGPSICRFLRVTEADDFYIRGFQIPAAASEVPGDYKVFTRALISLKGHVEFLYLTPAKD